MVWLVRLWQKKIEFIFVVHLSLAMHSRGDACILPLPWFHMSVQPLHLYRVNTLHDRLEFYQTLYTFTMKSG